MFNEYKANEVNYRKKLQAYREAYPNFQYDSPSMIPKDNFETSYYNQYDVGPSGTTKGSIKCTCIDEGRRYYRGGHRRANNDIHKWPNHIKTHNNAKDAINIYSFRVN